MAGILGEIDSEKSGLPAVQADADGTECPEGLSAQVGRDLRRLRRRQRRIIDLKPFRTAEVPPQLRRIAEVDRRKELTARPDAAAGPLAAAFGPGFLRVGEAVKVDPGGFPVVADLLENVVDRLPVVVFHGDAFQAAVQQRLPGDEIVQAVQRAFPLPFEFMLRRIVQAEFDDIPFPAVFKQGLGRLVVDLPAGGGGQQFRVVQRVRFRHQHPPVGFAEVPFVPWATARFRSRCGR